MCTAGEVGIDDALVMETKEEIFEMNNGCICCTGPAAVALDAMLLLAQTLLVLQICSRSAGISFFLFDHWATSRLYRLFPAMRSARLEICWRPR